MFGLFFSDGYEIAKWVLIMVAMMVVTFAVLGAGAYVFVRVLAKLINSRRNEWEDAAKSLHLEPDRSQGSVQKDLVGRRDGGSIRVSYYAVMRSEQSSDPHASAEVSISPGFDHTFEISKLEMLYQRVAEMFDMTSGLGIDIFDKAFSVTSSDPKSLRDLLLLELPAGESPTLMTDLMHARKRFHRVLLTDSSATIGIEARSDQTDLIESAIERAIYLAKRAEAARSKLAVK